VSIFNKFSHKEYGRIMLVRALKKAKVYLGFGNINSRYLSRSFVTRW
jgi:hypothetical protein